MRRPLTRGLTAIAAVGLVAAAIGGSVLLRTSDVVMVVDGHELSRAEFDELVFREGLGDDCYLDAIAEGQGSETERVYVEWYFNVPAELRVLGRQAVFGAIEAEAKRRGIQVSDVEVAGQADLQRSRLEPLFSGEPETCQAVYLQAVAADIGGVDRFWSEVLYQDVRHDVRLEKIMKASGRVGLRGYLHEFTVTRDADIRIADGVGESISEATLREYLREYERRIDVLRAIRP